MISNGYSVAVPAVTAGDSASTVEAPDESLCMILKSPDTAESNHNPIPSSALRGSADEAGADVDATNPAKTLTLVTEFK